MTVNTARRVEISMPVKRWVSLTPAAGAVALGVGGVGTTCQEDGAHAPPRCPAPAAAGTAGAARPGVAPVTAVSSAATAAVVINGLVRMRSLLEGAHARGPAKPPAPVVTCPPPPHAA